MCRLLSQSNEAFLAKVGENPLATVGSSRSGSSVLSLLSMLSRDSSTANALCTFFAQAALQPLDVTTDDQVVEPLLPEDSGLFALE